MQAAGLAWQACGLGAQGLDLGEEQQEQQEQQEQRDQREQRGAPGGIGAGFS
jgi:hypothetical protein